MSTALAIASVTHVLKDLLNNGLIDQNVSGVIGGNVNVSALPPDRIDVSEAGQTQLNLFMYRVTTNNGWSNLKEPERNSSGARISLQPLALNLHYLLTAYGASELHAEILLGYGMQLLHETPILDREAIRLSLLPASASSGGGLPNNMRALAFSDLNNQPEQIKIVPEQINTEEISKLWTAFQAKYRPTAAYMVSVVLIESDKPVKSSLPVHSRNIFAFPFQHIFIERILSRKDQNGQAMDNQKIITGHQLIIKGKNLYASQTEVTLNGKPVQNLNSIEDEELIFTLTGEFLSGIQALQVVHKTVSGQPPKELITAESNIEPFVICPSITAISVNNLVGNGNAPRSADIQIQVSPAFDVRQKIVLLLNEYNPALEADQLHAYNFVAPSIPVPSPHGLLDTVTIQVKDIMARTYIVRLRVDGAESPLSDRDSSGYFFKPNITIN